MKEFRARNPDMASVYLLLGQGGVYQEPTLVQTVLGSCVSVTFFSRRHALGGIFHALMPSWRDYLAVFRDQDVFRYVDSALEKLHREFARRGIKPAEIECKVFGGASAMFQGEMAVGAKNVRMAYDLLASLRLRVVCSNVGGVKGRKLFFSSHTGEVFIKAVANGPALGAREMLG